MQFLFLFLRVMAQNSHDQNRDAKQINQSVLDLSIRFFGWFPRIQKKKKKKKACGFTQPSKVPIIHEHLTSFFYPDFSSKSSPPPPSIPTQPSLIELTLSTQPSVEEVMLTVQRAMANISILEGRQAELLEEVERLRNRPEPSLEDLPEDQREAIIDHAKLMVEEEVRKKLTERIRAELAPPIGGKKKNYL